MKPSLRDGLFYLGLAFLVTHELDAMTHAEWRLLPPLSMLEDDVARPSFVALHVPLVALITWLTAHPSPTLRRRSRLTIDGFLVAHGVAHALFSAHPLYSFDSVLSNTLIFGGALTGLAHLIASGALRKRTS